ncbi:hypothetical protein [Endozoicomonas ascidiicola]|uniref:hypothetical protein n=1 Tax=Endozoicomonas ascidiicola TaxID=1698521 RepID=UPI0008300AC8|nr:hypothetical protein [Endozoicomonas ascidiicola]
MTHTLVIPAIYLFAVSHFQAKNDVRYYLNGVAIYPKRKQIVATDGHTMCIVTLTGNEWYWHTEAKMTNEWHRILGAVTGDSKGLKLAKPKAKEQWAIITIDEESKQIDISYSEIHLSEAEQVAAAEQEGMLNKTQRFSSRIADGIFPRYENIKPDYSSPISSTFVGFHADYLIRVGTITKLFGGKYKCAVLHYPIHSNGTCEWEIVNHPNVRILLMGMRIDKEINPKATLPAKVPV